MTPSSGPLHSAVSARTHAHQLAAVYTAHKRNCQAQLSVTLSARGEGGRGGGQLVIPKRYPARTRSQPSRASRPNRRIERGLSRSLAPELELKSELSPRSSFRVRRGLEGFFFLFLFFLFISFHGVRKALQVLTHLVRAAVRLLSLHAPVLSRQTANDAEHA